MVCGVQDLLWGIDSILEFFSVFLQDCRYDW